MKLKKIRKNTQKFFGIFILIFSIFNVFLAFPANNVLAVTGAPKILSQQGRLLNSSGDLLGGSSGTDYCFKFSIYDASSSGTKLWPSGSPSSMTFNVKNGVFNALVGDTSAGGDVLDYNFQDNDTVYLNVEVATKSGSTCGTFETLTPRQRVASSGYSLNANTVGGFTPAQSATGNQIPVLTSGNLILGSGGGLVITGGAGNPTATNGTVWYDTTANKYKIVENGTVKTLCNTTDAGCGAGGSGSTLQAAYDATGGNIITTTTARDIDFVLDNTATDSNFDIDINAGSTSTVSISRLDGADTGFPAQLLLLENLDTTDGPGMGLLITSVGALDTAIDLSSAAIDTALNVGGNNIIGGTAGITFTDFILSTDGKITFASDTTGDQMFITAPSVNFQALVVDATTNDSTQTEGMIDLNVDTATNTAIGGLALDFAVKDAGGNLTVYGNRTNVTVDTDTGQSHTVAGEYIGITANDASSTTYGLQIVAEDAGEQVATAGLLIENLQATDIDLTDAVLVRATTADSIVDAFDASDTEITNALNVGDNIVTGGDWTVINATDIAEGLTFTLAGGIGFDITGTAGQDFRVTNTGGSIALNASEAIANAIAINASNAAGGIDIDYGTGDIVILGTGVGADFTLDADLISIDGTGTSNFTITGAVDEDFTIAQVGSADNSLIISSTGTTGDALQIKTTAGGIDITSTGAAAGEDIDITTNASVNIFSSEAAVSDAIKLTASDAAGQIFIDAGTTDKTADAIRFDVDINSASVDGLFMDLDVGTALSSGEIGNGLNIDVAGLAGDNAASAINAISLTGDVTSAGTVTAIELNGSFDDSIDLSGASTTIDIRLDDGLTISQTSDDDLDIVEGSQTLNVDFAETTASTITFGTASNLEFESTANSAASLKLESTLGGIDIFASGAGAGEDIDIMATGSSINIQSSEAISDAILIEATGAGGSMRLTAGTGEPSALTDGSDIEFLTTDDILFTPADDVSTRLAAGDKQFLIDALTNANTSTGGVIDLNVSSITTGNIGLNIDYTSADGVANDADMFGAKFNITQSDISGDLFGLVISNLATSAAVGADAVECLLCLDNVENTANVLSDAIRITNSGGTDNAITTGLDFDTVNIVTDIELQNGETIDNNTNGTILFTAPTTQTSGIMLVGDGSGDYLSFSEESGDPTGCAAGEFRIWATTTGNILRKCENGAVSNLDAAGSWSEITAPSGNLTLDHKENITTFTWDNFDGIANALDYFKLASTNDADTDGATQRIMVITNNDAAGAGVGTTETLLALTNADANEAITNGILFDATGAGGATNALQIANSGGGTITTGINFASGTITTGIDLSGAASTTDIILDDGLTIAQTSDNDLDIVEGSQTLNIDFAETTASTITFGTVSNLEFESTANSAASLKLESTLGGIDIFASGAGAGEDIDIVATGSSVNITSTEGVADGLVFTSTNGGIDITTTGAAAGEDIDVTSSASLNLVGQEAVTDAVLIDASNASGGITMSFAAGGLTMANDAASSGTPTGLVFTGALHTALANAEATDVNFNLGRTVQFTGTATLPTQRAFRIQNPTYSSDTATKTINNAITLSIGGPPIQGTNVTLGSTYGLKIDTAAVSTATNAYGLYVEVPTGATNNWSAWLTGSMGGRQGTCVRTDTGNLTVNWSTVTGGAGNNCNSSSSNLGVNNLTYYVEQNAAATATVFTVNIDTIPNIDGTIAFVVTRALTCGAVSNRSVVIQVQGTTVMTNTCSATVTDTELSGVVIRGNGTWRHIGYFPGSTNDLEASDLAEWISYTGQKPVAGELLSAANASQTVEKSNGAYQRGLLSFVSTKPHTTMGKQTENSVPIVLAGRAPVIVTTRNGNIKNGDPITSSSMPGVGMRAWKAGITVGKALENTDDWNDANCPAVSSYENISWPEDDGTNPARPCFNVNGVYIGKIMMMMEYGYTEGDAEGFVDAAINNAPEGMEAAQAILTALSSNKQTDVEEKDLSQIYTDRIIAGLEVIAPEITTKKLSVDEIIAGKVNAKQILGLEIFTDKISVLDAAVAALESSQESASEDISESIAENSISVQNLIAAVSGIQPQIDANGETIANLQITFDKLNENFTVLSAAVSGIQPQVDANGQTLANLQATFDELSKNFTVFSNYFAFDVADVLQITKGLKVNALATFSGGLQVDSIDSISGMLSFVSDVSFFGTPYFNTDTAGFAVIHSGDRFVDIVFEKEYLEKPIVNATISLESDNQLADELVFTSDIRFIVTKKSVKGFTIVLNKPAPADIIFSWTAFAVKNPRTFFSLKPEVVAPAASEPAPSLAPASEPVVEPAIEPVLEPASEPQPASDSEPAPESVPESESTLTPASEPVPEPSPEPAPAESDPPATTEPVTEPAPEPALEPVPESISEPTPESAPEPAPAPEPTPSPEPAQ